MFKLERACHPCRRLRGFNASIGVMDVQTARIYAKFILYAQISQQLPSAQEIDGLHFILAQLSYRFGL